MTTKEELSQEIESTPEALLVELLHFLRFIKSKQNSNLTHAHLLPTPQPFSTGQTLLKHLNTIGTWQGDDINDCLRSVYESRSQAKFESHNPLNA